MPIILTARISIHPTPIVAAIIEIRSIFDTIVIRIRPVPTIESLMLHYFGNDFNYRKYFKPSSDGIVTTIPEGV